MDASVGLTFSLRLFQRYQRNGILQAEIRHVSGMQGPCTAYIHLTTGSVTACYVENKQGQRLSFSIEELCRIDLEKGPFAWVFHQQSSSPSQSQKAAPSSTQPPPYFSSPPSTQDASVPRAIAQLRWEQFNSWTLEQKLLLQHIWQSIDGKRTIRDIKVSLPYPPQAVDEVLQILANLRIIVLA